jgi:inosine/xanthosine triphosphatase
MRVGIGGTFNVLHHGHKVLLDRAFAEGDLVVVGITSDAFARDRKEDVIPLAQRKEELETYLRTKGTNWSLAVIDSFSGRTEERTDIDALVVSPETKAPAEEINRRRAAKGLPPLKLIIVPHVLAQDSMPISSTRVMSGEIDREGRLLRPLRVNVGSENRIKIDAVKNVLSQLFDQVDVRGADVRSSVPEQPRGKETRQGAVERAAAAIGDADLGIGLEAGVFDTEDGLYDIQYCAVMDRRGRCTVGHGSGFRYPPAVEKKVKEGATVGNAFKELYSWEREGKKDGAIGFLTKGALKRTGLAEQAVMAAMVPRIRPDLYPDL